MLFYPRLLETLSYKIPTNRVNAEIRRELVSRFPDKYEACSSPGSVKTKKRGEITAQDLANDIMMIVNDDRPDWEISEPEIRLAKRPEGLSGTYQTIFFTINGNEEKFVLRGEQNKQASGTPTNVKECLVCYFFKSEKKYSPFKKVGKSENKEESYTNLLTEIVNDIKMNGIPSCLIKDVKEVLNFLEYEVEKYNIDVLNSIFNSMSVGNYLRTTKFKDWDVNRGRLFNNTKDKIGRQILGFDNVDKWNPMDIMLIKPESENEIEKRISEAEQEKNSDLQIGKINSLFVNDLESKNDESLILAISLKEQLAQAGKAKGFIKKISPKFGETYNLSPEEKQWYDNNELLAKKIIEYRNNIKTLINTDEYLDDFTYQIEKGGIEDYDIRKEPLKKYAALKMMLYILAAAKNDKNIFTGIIKFGLSLENNPTYFKLKGNIEGNEEKVKSSIEKFPAASGIQLYDSNEGDFDGKILIRDSNDNMGIYVEYYIEFEGIIYFARVSIRANQSGRTSQVTVEINKWKEIKNMNESVFYPRLVEKFSEESDPIYTMGVGIRNIIEKYKSERNLNNDESALASMISDIQPESWTNKPPSTEKEYLMLKSMIEFLVKQPLDPNQAGFYGIQYSLNIQNPKRRMEILKLVLQIGVKIKTMKDWIWRDFASSKNPDLDISNELILIAEVGYTQRKEKFKSIFADNVLKWAAEGKNTKLCKWALNKGANPAKDQWESLRQALEHEQDEIVKMLLPYLIKEYNI